MTSLFRGLLTAIVLGILPTSVTAEAASPASIAQGLVLVGVTIVDTHNGELTRGMAIVIDGGKIVKIVRAKDISVGGSARSVDARGKFVVPGYLEMHAHPLGSSDAEGSLTLMLANGITGFRQMSGSPQLLEQRRQGTLMPAIPAPELLAMPGSILIRVNAGSPDAAIAEVQKQKSSGADFIKVIDVGPDAFFAALKEAKLQGLDFIGHLPPTVNAAEAAQAGMRGIEHLGPMTSLLLGCSTDEAALRASIAQRPPRTPGPNQPGVAERATANPVMVADPADYLLLQRLIDTYSEAKCRKLAALFVATGAWQEPTLIRVRTMEFGDDPTYRSDPNLRFKPRRIRELWEALAQEFPQKISPETRETLNRLFALQLKLVMLFDKAGVKMLAGSDSGGSGQWGVPGFALHREFDLLAQAGLSPLRVLQMTTLDGAKFLGREKSMGSVERGKNADLVLLDANPIASVQNLHRIHAVVRGGTYYSADELKDMEKRTADRQADEGAPGTPTRQ
jgi:hypothetical protein